MPTTATLNSQQHLAGQLAELADDERDTVVKAHNERAQRDLRFFAKTVNQGEWIAVTRLLGMSRDQIADDDNLTLLALLYVHQKRDAGASSIDQLLELTDVQLAEAHGFVIVPDTDDELELEQPAEQPAEQPVDQPVDQPVEQAGEVAYGS